MSNFNGNKKEPENFDEVPQEQPPFARNVSISNAEEFAIETVTADDFCVEDDEKPISGNTSVLCQDHKVGRGYWNDEVSHGGSQFMNISHHKFIPSGVTRIPEESQNISITKATHLDDNDLFVMMDKISYESFVKRNQNLEECQDVSVAITNFESPLNAEETDSLFTKFLREKNVVCDVVVPGMFYKCYHSEDFSSVSIHVKLYFHAGKNPTMEFRRVQGSPEIFLNIYGSFRNLILNENNPVSMCPPPCDMISEKVLMSKDEEDAAEASLLQWLKSSPTDAIKVVSQVAMEKDKDTQIIMCNEVYNVLHKQKDLTVLMAQTLEFINVIKGSLCLLDEHHKILILSKLRIKLQASVDAPNIHESVKQRAQIFIDEETKSV